MKGLIAGLIVSSMMLMLVAPALADNLILQVPDWNQPLDYNAAYNYPQWCSPSAGGDLLGYWDDVKGCNGLTDNQAFPASPAYANNANAYTQGLYHDGIVELGYFMGTDGWVNPAKQFPPNATGTAVANILPGLLNYASAGWIDPLTGIVKTAYPNTAGFTQASPATGQAVMWSTYTSQIDQGHPVEVTFDRWVGNANGITVTVNGQTVHEYNWEANLESEGHSVVGVGYFVDAQQHDWFICEDNWPSTPEYVAVQMDYAKWWENDYITAVPEPSAIVLLVVGALSVMVYGWRRRGTM